jgi:flagellin-like hook-associated protein FlgL
MDANATQFSPAKQAIIIGMDGASIEDADFVAEAADLAKNQILAQSAATAMLAQASAISQNVSLEISLPLRI